MIKKLKSQNPNFKLMISSLLLAMVLWYMINYFSDPTIRMTVSNVNVEIVHGEFIENRGDVYTVLDNTDVVPTVTIRAKRSVIDKLDSSNIIATADARSIREDGTVPIAFSTDKYSGSIEQIQGSLTNVSLRVEPLKTKSLALEVETTGSPADGYILYETGAEQNQVNLSGPQSFVEEVERATVVVDITDSERSINSYPDIKLYGLEGSEITAEEMKTRKLHLNISSVKVVATIYPTKTVLISCGGEVPIADGYELESNPVAEPSSILIAGPASALRQTDRIEIPAEDIASDPVTGNIHKLMSLEKYLPEGIVLPEEDSGDVTVYIRVKKTVVQKEKSDSADTADTASAAEQTQDG